MLIFWLLPFLLLPENGMLCYRMALQTREQHIKREKATSNICTSQALLATMASFYAVYHGQEGIKDIAIRINNIASLLNKIFVKLGYKQLNCSFFDTLRFALPENLSSQKIRTIANEKKINLKYYVNGDVGISIDETTSLSDINMLVSIFSVAAEREYNEIKEIPEKSSIMKELRRKSPFLTNKIFSKYHSETDMMRYLKRLERKDISLAHSMISLGSCTMKLNAASEMLPLSNAGWMNMHPLAPADQAEGYMELITNLSEQLALITGMDGVTLQPNSGAAGEYTGLRVIAAY